MNFDGYFRLTSYAVVACGALALLATGGISAIIAVVFTFIMIAAWRLENTKWQISERFGLVLIVLALPLYYLDWQYQAAILTRERAGAATLAHLILGLSVIKLFQIKNDRDWVFLYLISFFEILLAAGLSISPLFLGTLFLYLLFAVCTIIAFEIRKAKRFVKILERETDNSPKTRLSWRLPVVAAVILLAISLLAAPTFFMMPRVGGAGFSGGSGGGGLSGFIGFSDSVRLGAIGRLQQNSQVVMRVRVEAASGALLSDLRWRGAALDFFDNQGWRNSFKAERKTIVKDEFGFFQVGEKARQQADLIAQTIYLEPVDTQALFGAGRIIAVQGNFSQLQRDVNEGVTLPRSFERVAYKVFSDAAQPDPRILRADKKAYQTFDEFYLQLPQIDPRIAVLATEITEQAAAKNRYDTARAIETYLQTQLGYTLDLKAGGEEPLADFLFNVREGHCEYFATAMAVMLRTRGIATRVVNGFQAGEYNDAAGAFIVTQKEAHSWVEVYFPESDSWVTFDPTPAAGKNLSEQAAAGNFVAAQFNKYLEALNVFWLQYVVAYDNQEQRNLARAVRESLSGNQTRAAHFWQIWQAQIKDWWENLSGARGAAASWQTIGKTVLGIFIFAGTVILLWLVGRRVAWRQLWQSLRFNRTNEVNRVVEFYERMLTALAKKGLRRAPAQTPLEFALTVGAGEALQITEAYNRVRFGDVNLSGEESKEIESWLQNLENNLIKRE